MPLGEKLPVQLVQQAQGALSRHPQSLFSAPKPFDEAGSLKEMLELDLKMELADVESYSKRADQAEKLGLVELKVKLEEMAAEEAGHARELRRLLKGL